ncbi:hypothetical protein BH20VER3_BH20VER3_21010 [soil metagenome]
MTRFLILIVLLTVSATAESDLQPPDWWPTVVEKTQFIATSRDGSLKLNVKLVELDVTEKTVETPDGEQTQYYHNGTRLPADFWPGRSALVQFELYWDGKRVPIEDKFWRDLYGFRIQASTVVPAKVPDTQKYQFDEFLSRLDQPRVILSADGGTALIEWERPEECDSRATYRWIVTRDGRVLRHCDRPPHECLSCGLNQAMQLTASRRTAKISITPTSNPAATRAPARSSSSCSR